MTLVHGSPRDPTWEYVTSPAVARASLAVLDDDPRPARPHPRPGRLRDGRRPDRDARAATPATPLALATACDARSTRAASASRATATRGRATWSSIPRPRTATWHRVAYDIEAVQAAMRGRRPAAAARRAAAPSASRIRADDRRPAAAPGPQAGRPARPRRAPARAVLPLHGPGPAHGQGGGQRPDDARPAGRSRRSAALFVGRPLASEDELGERLTKKKALAIFSSDAISSSAYATEEILRVLILGGVAALASGSGQHRDRDPAGRRSRSATARSASPTRPAAARTRSRAGTSAGRSSLDRRLGAAHRLRHDRRRVDVVGRRADHLGLPRPASTSGCSSASARSG